MSTETTTIDNHGGHAHVAHHFDSAQQQFDAGKLGMWLFLVTEILFFSGLFVAYAVYRANHPDVFVDAHHHLNTALGALNTIVLLLSSLTMAWAVRCAQIGERRRLIHLLAITLACASFFLGVKAIEYSHKWNSGLLWAGAYTAGAEEDHRQGSESIMPLVVLSTPAAAILVVSAVSLLWSRRRRLSVAGTFWLSILIAMTTFFAGLAIGYAVEHVTSTHSHHAVVGEAVQSNMTTPDSEKKSARLIGVFFSIYYAMTGVHAIHILAGMGVIAWLLLRAIRQEFGPETFGPVDYLGLYWHLVDLVWIYLFPLLYLIR